MNRQRFAQTKDVGIKLESITTRLHPKSSLEQRYRWLDELDYIFEASPQRYVTDKAKIAAAFFCIEANTRGQWTNYRKDNFSDNHEPTWEEFEKWTLEFIRGGRMTDVDIYESYYAAKQRPHQDPRSFHHYLQSIENHMDISEKQKALGFFAKLVEPLKRELKVLYQNELPQNREDMVSAAIRTWDSREMGNTNGNSNPRKRSNDDHLTNNGKRPKSENPRFVGSKTFPRDSRTNHYRNDRPSNQDGDRQNDERNHDHLTCYNCFEKGHVSTNCPNPKKDRNQRPPRNKPTAQVQEITQDDEDQGNYSESEETPRLRLSGRLWRFYPR